MNIFLKSRDLRITIAAIYMISMVLFLINNEELGKRVFSDRLLGCIMGQQEFYRITGDM
jgi:hypothetical protein